MTNQENSLLAIIGAARRRVPAVDYALGAAGIAAAGALVIGILGHGRAAAIILGGMLAAMFLLLLFDQLARTKTPAIMTAGISLMWAISIFFILFLIFTTTAVAFKWPIIWFDMLFGEGLRKVSVCLEATEQLTVFSCGGGQDDDTYVIANVPLSDVEGGLNIRASPSVVAPKLGLIPSNGIDIRSLGSCELSWCPVQCNQIKGWAHAEYLRTRRAALRAVAPLPATQPESTVPRNIEPPVLRIRNGPDHSCGVVATIPQSARNIIAHSCQPSPIGGMSWCEVTFNNTSGWVPENTLISITQSK